MITLRCGVCGRTLEVAADDYGQALKITAQQGQSWGAWHHYQEEHAEPIYTVFYCPRHAD